MAREYVKGRDPKEAKKLYYERHKQYLQEHPEKVKEARRKTYLKNRDKMLEYQARYRAEHREELAKKRRERYWRETWTKLGKTEPPEMPENRMLSRKERADKKVQSQSKNA